MIKIRANFIQSREGSWHNLNTVKTMYIGGSSKEGYRICFSFELSDYKRKDDFLFSVIGPTHKTKEEAQAQLDGIFDLIEYERYGD